MDYRDYYQVLGVKRDASQAEIKRAFRKLARQHHPDLKPGDKAAEQRFKEVNEANAVLSDPEKRHRYDSLGANWEEISRAQAAGVDPFAAGGPFAGFSRAGGPGGQGGGAWGGSGYGGGAGPGGVRFEFRGADGGGFSDFFRAFFSGGAGGTATPALSSKTSR